MDLGSFRKTAAVKGHRATKERSSSNANDLFQIETLDYNASLHSLCPNLTNEELDEYAHFLGEWWFQLYELKLQELGFIQRGSHWTYEAGDFSYSYDMAGGGFELSEEWSLQNREQFRIVAVHGFSTPVPEGRESTRMRFWRNSLVKEFGDHPNDLKFDKGHFIAHKIGGVIDNGLFAQRADVNQGRGEFQEYRDMERYAQANPGVFVFSRPIYGDGTDHPFFIEYGILNFDYSWWIQIFPNRYLYEPYRGPDSVPEWRRELAQSKTWRGRGSLP